MDSELLKDIAREHQLLTQYTENLSGTIESFWGSSNEKKPEYSTEKRLLFFREGDLLRLEYISPSEGTEIYPGHEKNDITRVIMKSKDCHFKYFAIATNGAPYANLLKSSQQSDAEKLAFDADFYSKINAIVSLDYVRVVDFLQYKIGSVEYQKYNDISEALWIKGVEDVSKAGDVTNWTIVLNPRQHFALLFYEVHIENPETGYMMRSSGTRTSQVIGDGMIFPKEILFEGNAKAYIDGQKQVLNTSVRTLVGILSTDKPDSKLFTEESFKGLGRDYVVVDEKQGTGSIVMAAPPETRKSDYLIERNPEIAWPWSRIILLASGVILIIAACSRICFRIKRNAS